MSTQPQLSPLEQLAQPPSQQDAPASSSGLSPLEQLAQSSPTPPNPEKDASNTRQMMVSGLTGMPTPNMSATDRASFEQGKAAGAITAGAVVPAATIGLTSIEPVIAHLAENLPNLDKAWKIVKIVGGGTYTLQHLKDVLKVLGGGSNSK